MKLKDYLELLNNLAKENPAALEMEVCTSCDDEGNRYNEVDYGPSIGNLNDRDFIPVDGFEDYELEDSDANAVCLN